MGSINIDNTGSGGGITLSSDGTSLLLGGSAVGGDPDLYRDNASSETTPTASGANAVAIGSNARATGSRSVSIGFNTNSTQNYNVSIGHAAASAGVGGLAIGYDARADASYANAIGRSLATGQDSLAGAIGTNSGSYGATGANSVALGKNAKATGANAVSFSGENATASGSKSFAAGGEYQTASGAFAVSLGGSVNTASGEASYAFGKRALASEVGKYAYGAQLVSTAGATQGGMMVLISATTDATPRKMGSNNSAGTYNNQLLLPNNSAYAFHGTIVARQQAADGTACAAWKVEGLIRREANAGTTVLVNSATTVLDNTPSWGMALSADTTNGGLAITVTGAASTDIRWAATIHSSEVTYA